MKFPSFFILCLAASAVSLRAQPAFEGPAPSPAAVEQPEARRAAYHQRIHEVLAWRTAQLKPGDALLPDMGAIAAKLAHHEDADLCSRSVIAQMKEPGSGPFWMFPAVGVAYLLPVEQILASSLHGTAGYLPGQLLSSVAQGGTTAIGYAHSLVGALLYLAVAAATGAVLFVRRDVVS